MFYSYYHIVFQPFHFYNSDEILYSAMYMKWRIRHSLSHKATHLMDNILALLMYIYLLKKTLKCDRFVLVRGLMVDRQLYLEQQLAGIALRTHIQALHECVCTHVCYQSCDYLFVRLCKCIHIYLVRVCIC